MTSLSISTRDSLACLQSSAQLMENQIKTFQEQTATLQGMKRNTSHNLDRIETSIRHINSELEQYKSSSEIAVAASSVGSSVSFVGAVSFLVKGTVAASSSLMKLIPSHTEDDTIKQLRELLKNKMRELAHHRALLAEIDRCLEEISTTIQHQTATLHRIMPILTELKDISQICDGIRLKEELLFADILQLVERYESEEKA